LGGENVIRSYAPVAAVVLGLGCNQAIGGWDRYVETPPDASEVVGMWQPDQASLKRLAEKGYQRTGPHDQFMELRSDSSCDYHSYPHFGLGGAPFITDHECQWKVSTATAYVHHKPREAPAVEIELRKGQSTTITRFYIAHEDGRFVLWQFIGDPDYSSYMDLVSP
jgi:hypothetical protein